MCSGKSIRAFKDNWAFVDRTVLENIPKVLEGFKLSEFITTPSRQMNFEKILAMLGEEVRPNLEKARILPHPRDDVLMWTGTEFGIFLQ